MAFFTNLVGQWFGPGRHNQLNPSAPKVSAATPTVHAAEKSTSAPNKLDNNITTKDAKAKMSPAAAEEQDGFQLLQHGHKDMVESTAFNMYGDRFATGSVDGKVKVFNKHQDGTWHLCDTWGAHNAEILQMQWLPPTLHPSLLATLSTDGRFKLWAEDPTIRPLTGRRFSPNSNKPIFELRSPSRAPFLSFSLTYQASTRHTYLALVSRSAILALWENDFPEKLDEWNEIDRVNVCEKPARGEEVSFRVQFDPGLEPCWAGLGVGIPKDGLGIVVAGMERATVWRTKDVSGRGDGIGGSGPTKELYLACDLKGHKSLVRDVAWAPGSIRGYDLIATACRDGFVRVFQVTTPGEKAKPSPSSPEKELSRSDSRNNRASSSRTQEFSTPQNGTRNPSGIGAGLSASRQKPDDGGKEGEVLHVAKEISKLDNDRVPVWRVEFDADGQVMGSTGDDGKLILYRREPSGVWSKSSELAMSRSVVG